MNTTALETASKDDLKEELLRVRSRAKKEKDVAKEKSARLFGSLISVAAGGGLAYLMGSKEKEARDANGFADLSPEDQDKAIQEAQSIGGVADMDLVAGVVGVGIGMTDWAGEYGHFLNAAGVGALTAFASRAAYQKGKSAKE